MIWTLCMSCKRCREQFQVTEEDIQRYENEIRAEAIDEFAKELHRIMKEDGVCYERTIDKIAEQLKEKTNG